ncbi:MAG TPA: LamG-like jellyroll fold domain-containing protein [Candidatus Nitrosocosmicus sp.]|nr:LamG-like jellyroll fold domain-containing protein [Candidatus Nitrosocosmicus sp.]
MKKKIDRILATLIVVCLVAYGFPGTLMLNVSADANTGLAAHFRFDGDLKDSSGNGNDGTKEGNAITFVDAKFGKGAKFDGASYITVADSDSLDLDSQFSIVAWIYKEKPATNMSPVVSKGENSDTDPSTPYALYYDFDGLRPTLRQVTEDVWEEVRIAELQISNQKWHQLAVTKSGKSVKFYIDGVLSGTQSCDAEKLFASDGRLLIGANVADLSAYFTGVMDDLRIYNRALSNDEIKALMAPPLDLPADRMELITKTSDGEPDYGVLKGISRDGRYVIYESHSPKLNLGTGYSESIFVYDRAKKVLKNVAELSDGKVVPGISKGASISGDGRHVSFISSDRSLVPDDKNSKYDVFYRNLETGEIKSITNANGNCWNTAISNDGRYIVFTSEATNLTPTDSNGKDEDIFVYDRTTEKIEMVHVNSKGEQGNGSFFKSGNLSISDDGRYVCYASTSTNLVPDDTNNAFDVFIYDRQTKTVERITENGKQMPKGCFEASLSGNGRYVVFLPMTNENGYNLYVYDLQEKKYDQVNVSSEGVQGSASAKQAKISSDGRYVVFVSCTTNLASNILREGWTDSIYIHDRQTKTTQMADIPVSRKAVEFSYTPFVSDNGRYVAFGSSGVELLEPQYNPKPGNKYPQMIFVRDMLADIPKQ